MSEGVIFRFILKNFTTMFQLNLMFLSVFSLQMYKLGKLGQMREFPSKKKVGYSNFFQKLMTVIEKIEGVKGNAQKWFDGEVLEKLNLRTF